MAESWESMDDVTWEFKLKEGYTFHNGEPVNAEAFKFALDRGQEMFETGVGRTSYEYGLLNLAEVIAVDEYTLQIVTTAPNPLIPEHVAHVQTAAQPPQYIAEVGDEEFGLTGIGSGPYIITEFIPEEIVVMEAWDGYAGEKPSIQTIIWRAVPEACHPHQRTQGGQRRHHHQRAARPGPECRQGARRPHGARQWHAPHLLWPGSKRDRPPGPEGRACPPGHQLCLQLRRYDEQPCWLALASAPRTSSMPPMPAPTSSPIPIDPDKAAALLDEAGWTMGDDGVREKDGEKLAFEMDCPNGRYIKDRDMCLVLASDLKAVGIDVTVNVLDWSVFIDHASSQGAGFPAMHLIGSGPGFNCRSDLGYIEANTGSNRSQYANDEITALFAELDATFDPDARLALCHQIEEMAVADAAVVQVYMQVDFYAASDRMDWEPRADERILMMDAELR